MIAGQEIDGGGAVVCAGYWRSMCQSNSFLLKIGTGLRLGVANIARATAYRMQRKLGLGAVAVTPPAVEPNIGSVFDALEGETPSRSVPSRLPPSLFGWLPAPFTPEGRPDWMLNPVTGRHFEGATQPWHRLPDFDLKLGDIKCIWELSRWTWLPTLALEVKRDGSGQALAQMNDWLADWRRANPPYVGPNWKCGQEASIRVMQLAVAARILGQSARPSKFLLLLVREHLMRIAPTVSYAISQDNNHGTSEAAALFIGGSWIAAGDSDPLAAKWARTGRDLLENRVRLLVMSDGSFSQYSTTYHRLLLDTLSLAEIWRRELRMPCFSPVLMKRGAAAAEWLRAMVQSENGLTPILGANDGAHLLALGRSYRDMRPSVQLASSLFCDARAYPPGPWDDACADLGVGIGANALAPLMPRLFDDGGYAVLREGTTNIYIRYPRFHFRPSQADALHVDLWQGGVNWLRDGGTFSYAVPEKLTYYAGTASHNTVQFDGRDQMPRLSRFLFGAWLKTSQQPKLETAENGAGQSFSVGYHDYRRASHHRTVTLLDHRRIRVVDSVGGSFGSAVLRWRLPPGSWTLEQGVVSGGGLRLAVTASRTPVRIEFVEGRESTHYFRESLLPVLEVEVNASAVLTTEIILSDTNPVATRCATDTK